MVSVSCSMLNVFYRHPASKQVGRECSAQIVQGTVLRGVASGIPLDDDIRGFSRCTKHPAKAIARLVPTLVTASSTDPFERLIKRFKPPGCGFLQQNSLDLPRLLVAGKINAPQIARDPVTSGQRLKADSMAIVKPQSHQPRSHRRSLERFSVFARFGAAGDRRDESLDLFGRERSPFRFALTAILFPRSLPRSFDLGKQSSVLTVADNCPHRCHRRVDGGDSKTSRAKTRLKIEHVPSAEFTALDVTKVLREFAERLVAFFNTTRRHARKVIELKPRYKHDPRSRDAGSIQLIFEFQPCRIDMVSMSLASVELLMPSPVDPGPAEGDAIPIACNYRYFDFHLPGGDASHASSAFAER